MLVAALSALLFLTTEPLSYKVTLADGTASTARLYWGEGEKGLVRLESEDTRATWQPAALSGPTATVTGKLTRWEALPLKGGWRLQRPLGGALPLSAPLLTFHDMRLFLGKRYEELGAAPKRFLQLGYARERPGLDLVELAPAGRETLLIGGKTVVARRLRYTAKLWLNGKTQRGTIALGPSGELLRADPPFVSTPLRAASLLTKTATGGVVLTYKQPAYSLRAEPTVGGYTIKTLVGGQALPGAVTTDPQGRPLRIENDWPGKPFVGVIGGGELAWTLASPAVSRTVLPDEGDLALFPPQLFATMEWERTFESVGVVRGGVLLLFHEGLPEEMELERLADPREGFRRYRLTGTALKADLITDGTRLHLLRFAEGGEIVGPGAESLRSVPGLTWP